MKRWILLVVGVAALACCLLLFTTASQGETISGEWYYAEDGAKYLFQDGILVCSRHGVSLRKDQVFSGAYCVAGNKVLLFYFGLEEIEDVRELYLVHGAWGDVLCPDEKGIGAPVFYREQAAAERDLQEKP